MAETKIDLEVSVILYFSTYYFVLCLDVFIRAYKTLNVSDFKFRYSTA